MKEYDTETIEKAKQWFGDGEVDVDAMINAGAITLERIMRMYQKEVLDEICNQVEKSIVKNHKHTFVDAKDGTLDKVCSVCGIRAKQATVYLK